MNEHVFLHKDRQSLEPLKEQPFGNEEALQTLIADYPELLDGAQVRPDDPRRWILVTREKGIAETSDSSERWSVDHLLIDQDAIPTLVEVKQGSNSDLKRNVVGQLLVYAAHAALTWTADELRQTFENEGQEKDFRPLDKISELLGTDSEPDANAFWQKVETNLAAQRMRLLFVADRIPDPLVRVVEFLNRQMPDIEVLAIEIKQFRGESSETLVPRVIGRTAVSPVQATGIAGARTKLTRDSFLKKLPNSQAFEVAEKLLRQASGSRAILWYGSSSVSIRTQCPLYGKPVTVAWLHPQPGIPFWNGFRDVTFGSAIEDYSLPSKLRSCMNEWVNEFKADDFANQIFGKGTRAYSVSYEDAVSNIDLLIGRLEKVLTNLQELR